MKIIEMSAQFSHTTKVNTRAQSQPVVAESSRITRHQEDVASATTEEGQGHSEQAARLTEEALRAMDEEHAEPEGHQADPYLLRQYLCCQERHEQLALGQLKKRGRVDGAKAHKKKHAA